MTAPPTRASRTATPTRTSRRSGRRPTPPGMFSPLVMALPTALLIALLAVVLVPGRAHGLDATPVPPGAAWVRAGHFVPGFGAARIDLVPLAGAPTPVTMSPNAGYGDVTPYQKLAPGSYTVTLRPAGAPSSQPPLLQRTLLLTAGGASTIAAVGLSTEPRLTVLTDDLTPTAAGTARVRVLSATSLVPALTVTAAHGPTLASGAVLGQATGYAAVREGSWVVTAGAGTPAAGSGTLALAAGSVYTAVALDAGSTVRLELVTDAAGATAVPRGGAGTGGGWLATHDEAAPVTSGPLVAGGAGLVGAGAAGLVALLALRRRVRTR